MKITAVRHFGIGILLIVSALLTGCATSRGVIDPQMETGNNPDKGIAVRIVKVDDARHFEIRPDVPFTPSLMDDNIADEALRLRAIARKRNGFGQALGDVLLPEGQSVTILVQSAMTKSFREAGYRVVSPADPDFAQAIPVTAKIEKLWAWLRPGFWALSLESNYDIAVSAPIPSLQKNSQFRGQFKDSNQFITSDDWSNIVKKSLDDFSLHLRERLKLE